MFDKIDMILREIEEAKEEITIALNMANLTLLDYIEIKRGEKVMPDGLGVWNLNSIDEEVGKLKDAIAKLNKIRKEVLTFH